MMEWMADCAGAVEVEGVVDAVAEVAEGEVVVVAAVAAGRIDGDILSAGRTAD